MLADDLLRMSITKAGKTEMFNPLEEEINESFDSIVEEENFQRRVKQKYYLEKKWLIGQGQQKNVSPYLKKPNYKRSKSAPAGFGGS